MAPSTASIVSYLRQFIWYHLDQNHLRDALFCAQRLVAYEGSRSAEAAYLLALCQFQAGYTKASWESSRPFATKGSHLGCCYIYAQACLELGRYVDGLHAIEKSRPYWQSRNTWNQHNESKRHHLPDAPAMLCLKGKLWKAHKNLDEAVQCWVTCLKLNPFMWDAYTGLVESGAKISIPHIYRLNPEMASMVHAMYAFKEPAQEKSTSSAAIFQQPAGPQSMPDPFMSTQKVNGHTGSVLYEKLNNSKINIAAANNIHHDDEMLTTPSTVVEMEDGLVQHPAARHEVTAAPLRKTKSTLEPEAPSKYKSASTRVRTRLKPTSEEPHELPPPPPPGPPSKRTISGHVASSQPVEPVRRTTRSQTSRPPSVTSTNKMSSMVNSLGLRQERDIKKAKAPVIKPRTATTATVGRAVSGNRMKLAPSVEPPEPEAKEDRPPSLPPPPAMMQPVVRQESQADKDIESLHSLLDVFCRLASAHYSLQNYDCQGAIKIYNSLPSAQRESPYVLSRIARAYNEIAQYAEADKYFTRVRQLAPFRLEDMEIYSTVLYQLKSDIELAYLSHELVAIERNSPQTWIALGNSFSLQREHEQAIKCFKRATQLDPLFAYGFTLEGHEYVENEEFEKALNAYRSAVSVDPRHYNAWYGLGKVYSRLGKLDQAEQHYRTAASINPSNAVLTCAIGSVVEKTKSGDQALRFYDRACRLAPKNALSRFKKARCLMSLNRPEEALAELEILKEIAPEEPNVWFLSGKLCKMLGRKGDAVRAFTVALNLDPKAAQMIKDHMERLNDEDDDLDPDGDEDMD